METKELLDFIKIEHKRLLKFYNFKNKNEMTYPITLKIFEEIGEMSQAILHTNSLQRKEKLENNNENIGEELSDVIITILLLAENLDIDIKSELKNKIEKIQNRNY